MGSNKPRVPNEDGTWPCMRCGKNLAAGKFYPHGRTRKPQSTCKKCCIERQRMNRAIARGEYNTYEPSLDEIAEATAALRECWSERMHMQRAGMSVEDYEVDVSAHGMVDGDRHRKPLGSQIPK